MKHLAVVMLSSTLVCRIAVASPQIKFIGMARDDVVEIIVTTGKVNVGKQVRYRREPGDTVSKSGQTQYLFRDGKKIGVLIGKESDILRPFDTFSGEIMNTSWSTTRTTTRSRHRPTLVTAPTPIHRRFIANTNPPRSRVLATGNSAPR